MKLSDILHAFRWLGIEEADDAEETLIREVRFTADAVIVTTIDRDEDGGLRFISDRGDLAQNVRAYEIENDVRITI